VTRPGSNWKVKCFMEWKFVRLMVAELIRDLGEIPSRIIKDPPLEDAPGLHAATKSDSAF
jgi:hypothetical protein